MTSETDKIVVKNSDLDGNSDSNYSGTQNAEIDINKKSSPKTVKNRKRAEIERSINMRKRAQSELLKSSNLPNKASTKDLFATKAKLGKVNQKKIGKPTKNQPQ